MVVALGQQHNIGEKPTVMLYTYINRLAGTRYCVLFLISFVSFYYFILKVHFCCFFPFFLGPSNFSSALCWIHFSFYSFLFPSFQPLSPVATFFYISLLICILQGRPRKNANTPKTTRTCSINESEAASQEVGQFFVGIDAIEMWRELSQV